MMKKIMIIIMMMIVMMIMIMKLTTVILNVPSPDLNCDLAQAVADVSVPKRMTSLFFFSGCFLLPRTR